MKKWLERNFKVISTKRAEELNLKFCKNIYGDEINIINCRSLWIDKNKKHYRVKELYKNYEQRNKENR